MMRYADGATALVMEVKHSEDDVHMPQGTDCLPAFESYSE